MSFSSIPLAFLAGILGLLSPCVLPMLPAVIASASRTSKIGLWLLAAGLSLTFALSGTLLTFLFLNSGISADILRNITAAILVIMGAFLLIKQWGDFFSGLLSRAVSYLPQSSIKPADNLLTPFLVGASLGFVWLPCVGPTLGTAIALASQGQNMLLAFFIMLAYGAGSALPLILIGNVAGKSLKKISHSANLTRKIMGVALLFLGLSILTGFDHWLEIIAMQWLPDWAINI